VCLAPAETKAAACPSQRRRGGRKRDREGEKGGKELQQ